MPTRPAYALAVSFVFALAAALAPARPAAADAGGPCATPAGEAGAGHAGSHLEPYQLAVNAARYRLGDEFQYRLADGAAFRLSGDEGHRLNGAPPCVPPVAAAPAPAKSGAPVYAPAFRPAAAPGPYHKLINAAAKAADIQADLVHAVVLVESAYNSGALSPKGAQGLMQLMPATAARYTVTNPYDPAQNLKAGSRHLRHLLAEFDNDLKLALAAYNAGEEAVRRNRNGIPPYPETRDYVQRVVRQYYQRLNPHP